MTPTDRIIAFLDRWNLGIDEIEIAFQQDFQADTVYDNVGSIITIGPYESANMVREGAQRSGFTRMGYDLLNICEHHNKVFTERVDRFYNSQGHEFHSLRVMGIFELAPDGKIVAWRDYFDSRAMDEF